MSDMSGVDSHSAFQPLRYSYLAYCDKCLIITVSLLPGHGMTSVQGQLNNNGKLGRIQYRNWKKPFLLDQLWIFEKWFFKLDLTSENQGF